MINKQKTALVLIDLQKESQFGIDQLEQVVNNTNRLTKAFKKAGIPIFYTRHLNRADGEGLSLGEPKKENGEPVYYSTAQENHKVIDEIAPAPDDVVVDKYRWSAFYETDLHEQLQEQGIEHIFIGGFVTDGCLMTSTYDAYFRNYQINLIEDISGSTNEGSHMAAILIMANWIYNLKVFSTEKAVEWVNDKPVNVWECPHPDSLPFTPENMREQYQKLLQPTTAKGVTS